MAGGPVHWDRVYGARSEDELTWFEATPALSLELVRARLHPGEPFIDIDIGAGASRLVDVLLEEGFGPLTVLDLSDAALAVSRQRLGARGDDLAWIEADITTDPMPPSRMGRRLTSHPSVFRKTLYWKLCRLPFGVMCMWRRASSVSNRPGSSLSSSCPSASGA